MEADLGNMVDLEVQLGGSALGTIVMDKEWTLSAVRIEIFSVFGDKARRSSSSGFTRQGRSPRRCSHRREAHMQVTQLLAPTVLEIRAMDD